MHGVIWQGEPSMRPHHVSLACYGFFFWLLIPAWMGWRLFRRVKETHYAVTKRYVQIRNDIFADENRVLETYRVARVESSPSACGGGLMDLVFYATEDYTPPVRFIAVQIGDEDIQRIRAAVDATREKNRVASIAIPVLG